MTDDQGQEDLFLDDKKSIPTDVATLTRILTGRRGWTTRKSITHALGDGWDKRRVGQASEDSDGTIIGGNEGYMLMMMANEVQYSHALGRIDSQIRSLTLKKKRYQKRWHGFYVYRTPE